MLHFNCNNQLIQPTQMDLTEQQTVLFTVSSLSSQDLFNINSCQVEAECFCGLQTNLVEAEKQRQIKVLIQIVGNYVVQRSLSRQYIISAFLCDYQHQFEVLRKTPPGINKIGQPEGIRFIFKNPNYLVTLSIDADWAKHLEHFARKLSKKFIVQLGFHTGFKALRKIGKGMTACVYNALNFSTNSQVAIKSFKRSVYFAQDNGNGKLAFRKQFQIMTQVQHINICHLQGVYETDNSTYLIMELLPLSLYGYLQKFGFPQEILAKSIISQLIKGVGYLHQKNIMHRDLKLENIMVKKNQQGQIVPVIVDLGLAEYTHSPKFLYTRCGTPGYVAPEVLKIKSTDAEQKYGPACDIFSLGVIFYILLFKKPLFEGKDVKQVIKKNCECDIDFNSDNFKSLTAEGLDFFKRFLDKDPKKRITAYESLSHHYLQPLGQKEGSLEIQIAIDTTNSIKE